MTFQLAKLSRRIENRERRLARWVASADSDSDFARIERLKGKLANAQQKLDELTKQPDTFSIAVTAEEAYTRISITAVDSPDDDRFTGGDELLLRAVASSKFCEDGVGGRSYGSTRVIATEPVESQVINIGDSLWNEWENYDQVRLSLITGDDNEDTLVSEVFATADIYS